jgi:hypothetical protein
VYNQHDYQRQQDPERQADNEAIDNTTAAVHVYPFLNNPALGL